MSEAETIARLTQKQRDVIVLLSPEFRPAPRSLPRQSTAAFASKHSGLCEREWQDGCAQCTYYRLTPLGLAVRAILTEPAPGGGS